MSIIDTNARTTKRPDTLASLKAAGVTTVIRYLAYHTNDPDKVVTAAEAKAIAAAGFKLGLVYEVDGKPNGATIGARDGAAAVTQAQAVGAPKGAVIWYAVDYDPSPNDMVGVISAFEAFDKAVLAAGFRTGVYGSGYCNARLLDLELVDKTWLTCSGGFTGTRQAIAAGTYDLRQALPHEIANIDTDPDSTHVANGDIGDFVPFLGASDAA